VRAERGVLVVYWRRRREEAFRRPREGVAMAAERVVKENSLPTAFNVFAAGNRRCLWCLC